MKTIFITISRGALFRNFFNTGVISELAERGIRVVVLTLFYDHKEIFHEYRHKNIIIEPMEVDRRNALYVRLLEEFLKGASYNETVRVKYAYRFSIRSDHPKKIFTVARDIVLPLLNFQLMRRLIRFVDLKLSPQKEHDYLFEKYKPDLVLNTATKGDHGVLKSAKRFDVKTVDMPKSWDNLSKMLFNVKADYLMVWSEFMRRQALKYQGYKENEIIVTGVPQFDFYKRKEGLIHREKFCEKFGFDPKKKIILYGSGGDSCNEEVYVRHIITCIENGLIKDAQVLIRPHPGFIGDVDRYVGLDTYEYVAIDKSNTQNHLFKDHWDTSKNNVFHLYNSLYHADVCVNIASTLTLDAIACGTPVINIKYDVPHDPTVHTPATRWYLTDNVKAVTDHGGSFVVESSDALREALKDIFERNKKREEGMQKAVHYLMHKNDGRSSQRIANALEKLLAGKDPV